MDSLGVYVFPEECSMCNSQKATKKWPLSVKEIRSIFQNYEITHKLKVPVCDTCYSLLNKQTWNKLLLIPGIMLVVLILFLSMIDALHLWWFIIILVGMFTLICIAAINEFRESVGNKFVGTMKMIQTEAADKNKRALSMPVVEFHNPEYQQKCQEPPYSLFHPTVKETDNSGSK